MKKTLYELFDQATPDELELLSSELEGNLLPQKVLSSVKSKVYAKTEFAHCNNEKAAMTLKAMIQAELSEVSVKIGKTLGIERIVYMAEVDISIIVFFKICPCCETVIIFVVEQYAVVIDFTALESANTSDTPLRNVCAAPLPDAAPIRTAFAVGCGISDFALTAVAGNDL